MAPLRIGRRLALLAPVAGLLLAAACGCSPLRLPDQLPWPGSQDKPAVPARMTDMWTYTVLNQQGQPGVRGYGGRIMFYGNQGDKPIKVDGTLTVFAFEGTERDPTRARPLRKFVFPPEQLESHYSQSKLGHSYSFWLPWDEVGGPEQQISLITRFESRKGEALVGSPSRQMLAGAKPLDARAEQTARAGDPRGPAAAGGPVHPAAPQETLDPPAITTTTINLPPSFVQRSVAAAPQTAGTAAANAAPAPSAELLRLPPVQSPEPRADAALSAPPAPQGQTAAAGPPPARSSPGRFPARRGSIVAPRSDSVRRQPYPATWPSALPATPRSGWPGGAPYTIPDAPPGSPAPAAAP